jgi:hypothetical protein
MKRCANIRHTYKALGTTGGFRIHRLAWQGFQFGNQFCDLHNRRFITSGDFLVQNSSFAGAIRLVLLSELAEILDDRLASLSKGHKGVVNLFEPGENLPSSLGHEEGEKGAKWIKCLSNF